MNGILVLGILGGTAILSSKLLDWIKELQGGQINNFITQTAAFALGILVTFLAAMTDFADGVQLGNMTLGNLNGASLIYLGLMLGATGSWVYDKSPIKTPSLGENAPE